MSRFFFTVPMYFCLVTLSSAAFSQLPQFDASTMEGFRTAIEPTDEEVS